MEEKGKEGRTMGPKKGYKVVSRGDRLQREDRYENYKEFPILPMYANDLQESEMEGLRESIDCYDFTKSGFANEIDDTSGFYWVLKNAGGMDDGDISRFLDRLRKVRAAYQPMDDKCGDFEYCIREAVEELDDVLSSEYSYNSGGYCNTALVAGEGDGEERVYVTVDEDGGEAPQPAAAPFIPKGETVAMLTADGREMTVLSTGDGGYTSAYTGPQIDLAVGKVLSGELDGEPGVPPGGEAGQILAKKTGADYDTQWIDAPTGGGGGTAGVTSFNGRSGAVVPRTGDYTPEMVGALPASTQIPEKTSQLANDSGFATKTEVDAAIQQAILNSWEASY